MTWGRAAHLSAAPQMSHRPLCPCQKGCFSAQVLTVILPRHHQLCLCYSRQNQSLPEPSSPAWKLCCHWPPVLTGACVSLPRSAPQMVLHCDKPGGTRRSHHDDADLQSPCRSPSWDKKKHINMKETSLFSPRAPDHNRTIGHGEFHTAGLLRSATGNVKCTCTHTHHLCWPSQKDWPELLSGTV